MNQFDFPNNFDTTPASPANKGQGNPLAWLALATGLTLILGVVPFAEVLTYPIRLFVTFIHEGGHALAAVLTGGSVSSMTVAADGSGLTYSRGGFSLLISSAGYLGTTIFGAVLLFLAQKESRAKMLLSACGVFVLLLTAGFVNGGASWLMMLPLALAGALWIGGMRRTFINPLRWGMLGGSVLILLGLAGIWAMTGTLFSMGTGLFLAVTLLVLGRISSPGIAHFLVNFLAVQCCLNALIDIKTLFFLSVSTNVHSDAVNMARMTGLPAVVWATIWGTMALVILGGTLWTVFKRGSNPRVT
jgi:hypothetical protein